MRIKQLLFTTALLPLIVSCNTQDASNNSEELSATDISSSLDSISSSEDSSEEMISSNSSEEATPLNLHKVEAVNPTCTLPGNDEYYINLDTDELFEDAEGLIKLDSMPIVEALGHVCGTDYHCTRCGLSIRPERVNAAVFSGFEDTINHNFPAVPNVSTYTEVPSTSEKVVIDSNGNYYFTGNYFNGIEIETNVTDVNLILSDAAITASDNSALLSNGDAEVGIYLIPDTHNSITTNKVSNKKAAAISTEGSLLVFGTGSISINGNIKNGISCTKLSIKNSTLSVTAINNCISANSFDGFNANITLTSLEKKGLNIDSVGSEYSLGDGYVYLDTVTMFIDTKGDGISSSSYFYSKDSIIVIHTEGEYVIDTEENRTKYGLKDNDFTYRYEDSKYIKTPTDHLDPSIKYYALTQSCKGIKNSGIKNGNLIAEGQYYVYVKGSEITINSTDDAINSKYGNVYIKDSELTLVSNDDGITCDEVVYINGGVFNIAGAEGIEGKIIELVDGSFIISSSDDAINASSDDDQIVPCIIIAGGSYDIESQGDVIDANGIIWIIGGSIHVHSVFNKEGLLDADDAIYLDGGNVLGCGSFYEFIDNTSKQPIAVLRDDFGADETFYIYKNETLIDNIVARYYSTALIISNYNIVPSDIIKIIRGDNTFNIEVSNPGTNIIYI